MDVLKYQKKINTDHREVPKYPSRAARTLLGHTKLHLARLSLAKPRRVMTACPVKKD